MLCGGAQIAMAQKMATTNSLDQLLSSDVDESVISALVGSLESQLASPTSKDSPQQHPSTSVNNNHIDGAQVGNVRTAPSQADSQAGQKPGLIANNSPITLPAANGSKDTGPQGQLVGINSVGGISLASTNSSPGVTLLSSVNCSSPVTGNSTNVIGTTNNIPNAKFTTVTNSTIKSEPVAISSNQNLQKHVIVTVGSTNQGTVVLGTTQNSVVTAHSQSSGITGQATNSVNTSGTTSIAGSAIYNLASIAAEQQPLQVPSAQNKNQRTVGQLTVREQLEKQQKDIKPNLTTQQGNVNINVVNAVQGSNQQFTVKQESVQVKPEVKVLSQSQAVASPAQTQAINIVSSAVKTATLTPNSGVINIPKQMPNQQTMTVVRQQTPQPGLPPGSTIQIVNMNSAPRMAGQTTTAQQKALAPRVINAPVRIATVSQQPQVRAQGNVGTVTLPPGLQLPPGTVLVQNEQGQFVFLTGQQGGIQQQSNATGIQGSPSYKLQPVKLGASQASQGQTATSSVQSLSLGGNAPGTVGIRQQTSLPVTAARPQITTQQHMTTMRYPSTLQPTAATGPRPNQLSNPQVTSIRQPTTTRLQAPISTAQMRRMGPPLPPRLTHSTPPHMGPYSANGEGGGVGGGGRHIYNPSPYHHHQHGPPPPLLHHGRDHHGGPVMCHGGLSPSLPRGLPPPHPLPPSQSPPMRVQPSPERHSQIVGPLRPPSSHSVIGTQLQSSIAPTQVTPVRQTSPLMAVRPQGPIHRPPASSNNQVIGVQSATTMMGTVPTVVTGQGTTTISGAQVLTTGTVPSVVQAHTATGQATVQKAGQVNFAIPAAQQQSVIENVKKCKNFLSTLIKLASSQPPDTVKNVKNLIQGLIDGKIQPEDFTGKLQVELKSSPQPCLVPFLKKSLPLLRQSMSMNKMQIEGVRPPPPEVVQAGAAAVAAAVGARPIAPQPATRPLVQQITTNQKGIRPAGPQLVYRTQVSTGNKQHLMQNKTLVSTKQQMLPTTVTAIQSQAGSKQAQSGQHREKRKYEALKEDDDINDVATMGGVNLSEESRNILATNSELMSGQLRSCKDECFLSTQPLLARINAIAKKHGLEESSQQVAQLVSHATQEMLRNMAAKLANIAEHRLEIYKTDSKYEVKNEVKGQLKFLEELDKLERKRLEEAEREMLIRAAKSRSKHEDPEQLKLKEKAKALQQAEMEEARQREANLTALAAIGPRKKKKLDDSQGSGTNSTGSSSLGTGNSPRTSILRPRIKRVNLRDLLFLMEQDRESTKSNLLYRAYLK